MKAAITIPAMQLLISRALHASHGVPRCLRDN
jgi:hypothetical protein